MTDVDRYRAHLLKLATRHRLALCEIHGTARQTAHADVECGVVHIHPVTDDTSYAVALHEMGHLVAKDGHGTAWYPTKHSTSAEIVAMAERAALDTLAEEHRAWEWAVSVAIEWTAGMEQTRQFAEGTYIDALQEVRRVLAMTERELHQIIVEMIRESLVPGWEGK